MRLSVRIILLLSILTYVTTALAAVTVTVNGSNHTIPQTNEKGWGTNVTAWIQAISANTLQPSGGTFTLTAEVYTGATYGLKVPYIKTATSTPSTAGVLRLANSDTLGWRNNANGGNLLLSVDSSDRLLFNGAILPTLATSDFTDSGFSISDNGDATKKIAFQASGIATATTRTLTVPDASGTLVLLDTTDTLTNKTLTAPVINSPTGIVKGDVGLGNVDNTSDATKNAAAVTLTNKTIDADSNTVTNIANSEIKAGAAIDASKIADASVSDTEYQYISTLSSNAQTQLDAKQLRSTLTTKGDIYVATASDTVTRQGVGADGLFLKADSAQTNGIIWASPAGAGLAVASKTTTYTATTADDIILASTSGGAWTLTLYACDAGNTGKRLYIKKTTNDFTVLTIDGDASETIDGATTTTLNTQYEAITIVCDGANTAWQVIERRIPKAAGTWTPTATGLGTLATNTWFYQRLGNVLRVHGTWLNGTVSGSNVTFTLPAGLAADNTALQLVGRGYRATNTGGQVKVISAFLYTASATVLHVSLADTAASISPLDPITGTAGFATGAGYLIVADVPIAGWN